MSIADILHAAQQHERAMLEASRERLEAWAADTTAWERDNRPWQDRTGHARLGLTFVREHPAALEDGGAVALVHGVDYGKFLELAHGSQYAIIQPAVATKGPELVQQLKEVWK